LRLFAALRIGADAVDRLPPSRPGKEGPLVFYLTPSAGSIKAQEGLLHDIFGIMGIAEQSVSNAKDEGRLPVDQERKFVVLLIRSQARIAPQPAIMERLQGIFRAFTR